MSNDIDDKFFNTNKLGSLIKTPNADIREVEANAGNLFYTDGSDALANDGLVIGFEHVPSSKSVHFKAFIQSFNETFSSDWSEEPVYGRADPIRMFKQTTRSITLSFLVPAATTGEGYENLAKIQKFITFLYPNYTDVGNALTISQSPLIRMKVMNLITNNTITSSPPRRASRTRTIAEDFERYGGADNIEVPGLLGAITNVSINHNLDNPDFGVFHTAKGTVIPKAIEVTLDFKALHESPLGWSTNEQGVNFVNNAFPYGTNLQGALANSGRGNKEALEAAQNQEASAYTEGIRQQRQEEADRRSLQAAKDLAKAKLLKADGTLNKRGQRIKARLAETSKDSGDRSVLRFGIKDPAKAGAYAAALASTKEGATGASVRQAGIDAAGDAAALREERWSFLK